MWIIYITSCLLLASLSLAQRDGYCLASDYDPYLRFSTKTAYEFVKGRENNQHVIPGCRPIYFWSFNRHGTRLPGLKEMDELPKLMAVRDDIVSNYETRRTAPDRGRLCNQDMDNLKQWYWNTNYTKKFANDLTYQGYDDIKFLAKRWQTKFPELLPPIYSSRNFEFRFTAKRRTKDSYKAFIDGLFGRERTGNIPTPPVLQNDSLLELYEFCQTWQNEVKNNPATMEQTRLFTQKEEYKNLIMNVSNHLGYRYPLDESLINNIYDMCRYDKSWEIKKNSPWCAAFNKEQLQLLEYKEDLQYYYEYGYGSEINKKLGCSAVADLINKFKSRIESQNQNLPTATIYFTHSGALQPLLTSFGIAQDSVPLTSDNYHTPYIQRRKWRTSLIDPFASNLAAILYKCDQGDQYQVMFFLNEKPVEFEECRVGLCSWDIVKRKYNSIVNECNVDFCHSNSAGSVNLSVLLQITLFALSVLTLNRL